MNWLCFIFTVIESYKQIMEPLTLSRRFCLASFSILACMGISLALGVKAGTMLG